VGPKAGLAGTEKLALICIRSPDRPASRYTDYVISTLFTVCSCPIVVQETNFLSIMEEKY